MAESTTVEVYLVMDEDGEYEVAKNIGEAISWYSDNIGGSGALRVVKFNVTMSPPPEQTEVDVTVPDEAGQTVTASAS